MSTDREASSNKMKMMAGDKKNILLTERLTNPSALDVALYSLISLLYAPF
jgi:hypothetical protein